MNNLNEINDFIQQIVNVWSENNKDINQDDIDNLEYLLECEIYPEITDNIPYRLIKEMMEYLICYYSGIDNMETEHILDPIKTYAVIYGITYYENYKT